ncbi:MAG TPA: alpha/beta hydrolase [Gemmatimonadaceae bacterium]|jgi:pimeloyl-ACP methyl ester carboxylesterase|nr:alpha/beta hydrolase [Gemmatimonadaceae bacterium]
MTTISIAAHGTALAVALSMALSVRIAAQTPQNPWAGPAGAALGKYADVNGVHLYYEIHGEGRPLVLLHGGLGAGSMFGPTLAALAKGHQVILVDLQGHGRTADVDRPITLEAMSDDIAALLAHLKIAKADVMGYSLGGGVAFQTAVRHPEAVRKLVLVSTALRSNAFYPELRAQQKQLTGALADQMKGTPMYELYMSVAPRTQDFPRLLTKIGAFMNSEFDYTQQFAALQTPTLIVAGDADMFPVSHAVEAFALLDGGKRDGGWDGSGRSKLAQLAILPGVTHYNSAVAPALAVVAGQFLDAKE